MSELLYVCPCCAVMLPAGSNLGHEALGGAFRNPVLWEGRRSKKYSLTRQTGCIHGPDLAGWKDKPEEITGPWNTWALSEAEKRAAELKLDAERKRWFHYWLGIGPNPDYILP